MSDEKSLEELVSELAGRLSKSEKIKEECSLKFNAVKKALINCYGNSDDFVKVAYIDKACMDVRDLATFLAVLKLSVHNENNVNNTRLDNDGLSVFLINSICGSDISPVTREDLMDTAETLFIDGYIDTYRSNQAIAAMNKFTAKPNLFLVQYKFSMTMAAKDSEKMDTSDVLINFA